MKLKSLTLAACVALATAGTAIAGGKSTPNESSVPSAAVVSAAIAAGGGLDGVTPDGSGGYILALSDGTSITIRSAAIAAILSAYL